MSPPSASTEDDTPNIDTAQDDSLSLSFALGRKYLLSNAAATDLTGKAHARVWNIRFSAIWQRPLGFFVEAIDDE
ncbi:hypothetical protein Vi05172_g11383 [Venturia inaequalis]|nr:hypothetical protein Vi05172_g11383 [Venturia inaequalis]